VRDRKIGRVSGQGITGYHGYVILAVIMIRSMGDFKPGKVL